MKSSDEIVNDLLKLISTESFWQAENKAELIQAIGRCKRNGFVPPTVDDVRLYLETIGRSGDINPNDFVNFYDSKGWMIGKNKMKCWKSAVRTWLENSFRNRLASLYRTPKLNKSGQSDSQELL